MTSNAANNLSFQGGGIFRFAKAIATDNGTFRGKALVKGKPKMVAALREIAAHVKSDEFRHNVITLAPDPYAPKNICIIEHSATSPADLETALSSGHIKKTNIPLRYLYDYVPEIKAVLDSNTAAYKAGIAQKAKLPHRIGRSISNALDTAKSLLHLN